MKAKLLGVVLGECDEAEQTDEGVQFTSFVPVDKLKRHFADFQQDLFLAVNVEVGTIDLYSSDGDVLKSWLALDFIKEVQA